MNRRGLLLLAIVAAALAAYLVYDGLRRPGGGDHATAHARLLPPFDRKSVRLITIKRRRGPAFSMRRAPSPNAPTPAPGWRIEAADEPPADDGAIEDLLAAADLAESDRTADVSPSAAGLQPPDVTIELETAAAVLSAQLGRPDATGQGVYARAGADGPVRVIGRRLLDLADRDAAAFRDRRLLAVDPAAVTQIRWTGAEGEGGLSAVGARWRNGTGDWAANDRVIEALRRLLALRIESFEPGPPKTAGARRITVTVGATAIDLDVGSDGEIIRRGERLRVSPDALEAAWRSLAAAAVRDDRLVTQPPDAIARVELSDDHARVVLERVRGEWTFAAPKVTYAADTRVVDDWLARLGAVRGTRSAGPRPRHLVVDGRYPESALVSGPPDAHALLAPDPLRFRDRAVLSFARFDVRRVTRGAGADDFTAATDDGGTSWTSRGRVADLAQLARAVAALSDLRAEEFTAAPARGNAAVRWVIEVQAPGETRPTRHLIEIYPRADACLAQIDRDPAAARLDPTTCGALLTDPRKPAD